MPDETAPERQEKLGFTTVGNGPLKTIVLHGWFGDHTVWSPTFPLLDVTRFTYAFVDYRGYGRSRALEGQHTIAEIGTDALALAVDLGWDRFALVGHSMGGKVAQWIAMNAPDRVSAVVGVTPVPASALTMPAEITTLFSQAGGDDQAALAVIDDSLGRRLTSTMAASVLKLQRETSNRSAFENYFSAFSTTDFSDQADRLRAPLLILAGEHDGGISPEFVQAIYPTLYRHVEIEIVPNAGHYPMLETPAWLVTRIEEFLSQHAAG
ncbi:MAG TPA: alpha/beta fold hydrolase [Galbitalea sp.]|jgi:pimeloyl-ACP methyl ester carboxylesterase|nr:alpha/beta fold hydrolase [Galbitalea sp.]